MSDEAGFARQEQIWAGLYGPPGAAEMIAQARAHRANNPEMDLKDVFAAVEPDDDFDPDEAGAARPGFG